VLKERYTQRGGTLSGGESTEFSQSARALMLRPRLMLLDEPSSSWHPLIVRDLVRSSARVNREDRSQFWSLYQRAHWRWNSPPAYVIETDAS